MLQGGHRLSKLWRSPTTPLFNLSHRLLIGFKFSSLSQAKELDSLDEEFEEFLPWLERKAGVKISSVLSIGKSAYGRSLFASEIIRSGDCILKVPYSVQIAPDNLLPKIKAALSNKVGTVAKLAIILLVEQKMGQDSEWASYISCLPQHGEIHSTIFWSEYELDMIRQSSVYQETMNQKSKIEEDFAAVVPALEQFPEIFESFTLKDFMRAYFLVTSRAWESTKGLSLIPFTDFMNHDGVSDSIVLFDEDKKLSEVIADRNYAPGQENPKFTSIACLELSDLAMEAAQIDGRLARRPLKDSRRELLAHQMLLSHITHLMQKYDVAIKSLAPANFPSMSKKFALRRQMAQDLLTGDLRVLKSASTWLNNYCAALRATIHCQSQ